MFTRAIDEKLVRGAVDLAVHSLKDLPAELPEGVVLACVPRREDPRDALVSLAGEVDSLRGLAAGSRIGTSSPRRAAQIRALRPDCAVTDVRGNLDTRLKKLEAREFECLVVALAGLIRLKVRDRHVVPIPADDMLPCPGQGALGLTAREGDLEARELAGSIEDERSRLAADAERSFLKALGGSCRLPCGALAEVSKERIKMSGILLSTDGTKSYKACVESQAAQAEEIGARLKEELLNLGAGDVLPRETKAV